MTTARATAALLVSCALVVAGCSDSTSSTDTTNEATNTSTATSASDSRPECVAVADSARALAGDVSGFLSGSVAADQVRSRIEELSASVAAASESAEANAKEQWDKASEALGQAQDALAARPVDTAALRTSTTDALTALGAAVRACAPEAESVPGSVTAPATS